MRKKPEKTGFGYGWRQVKPTAWDLYTPGGSEWLARLAFDGGNKWSVTLNNDDFHRFEAYELREAMAICEKMCYGE